MLSRLRWATAIAVFGSAALACAPAVQMAPNHELARTATRSTIDATPHVESDHEALWFGDFVVMRLAEDAQIINRSNELIIEESRYRFDVLDRSGTTWSTRCTSTRRFLKSTPDRFETRVKCDISSNEAEEQQTLAKLELAGGKSRANARFGTIELGNETLEIRSNHSQLKVTQTVPVDSSLGFEIAHRAKVIGAVQTQAEHAFWIAPDIATETIRSVTGVAAASLLFIDQR